MQAIRRTGLAWGALAALLAAPAAAEDLVSASYRLRGARVAVTGPAWLTSTAPSPAISASGASVGQPEAVGWGLPLAGLEAGWAGFWPIVAGALPSHDLDGDGIPSLTDLDDDGDGALDAAELAAGTDPLDPDSDDDWLCDGPPSSLPACTLGGEDLDGDGVYDAGSETDPNDPDTDGDGWNDGPEVIAGTSPLDPNSYPGLIAAAPALGALGLGLLTGLLGLIGITRLRRRSTA